MTCKCGSHRLMVLHLRHKDLASVGIPHLDFDHDGYMPYIGPWGGDDTNFTICLDCGRAQNWVPITDDEITESDWFAEAMVEKKRERQFAAEQESRRRKDIASDNDPEVFTLVHLKMNEIKALLRSAFGNDFMKSADAQAVLVGELDTATGDTLTAVTNLLEQMQ